MYCRVSISATSTREAQEISRTLVAKRLVAGTMIYGGPCHYRWKGKIVQKHYWNINAFSLLKHKRSIVECVKDLHRDQVPIVAFEAIAGNKEFLQWINESVK